jgi:hypothetical protein
LRDTTPCTLDDGLQMHEETGKTLSSFDRGKATVACI